MGSRGEEGAESSVLLEFWADSQWEARAYSWVSGGRTEDEEGVVLHSSHPSVSMESDVSTVEIVEVWPFGSECLLSIRRRGFEFENDPSRLNFMKFQETHVRHRVRGNFDKLRLWH